MLFKILPHTLYLAATPLKLFDTWKHLTIVGPLPNSNNAAFIVNECFRNLIPEEKIPHRNRSQVQVSLKVTAQIDHLNITVTLDFF